MRLGVFEYIDKAANILAINRERLEHIAYDLEDFFFSMCEVHCDKVLNVNKRIKSESGLREKILRKKLYKRYAPDELMSNLSDLIGIRLECRFIPDEKDIYKYLKTDFEKYVQKAGIPLFLDFSAAQPQKQKNGFQIYRIDGYYLDQGEKICFELQIKSLVNVFWGEIEHKVIYKNYTTLINDELYSKMMTSIKNNLTTIDNQLHILYTEIYSRQEKTDSVIEAQMIDFLAKFITDFYSNRISGDIGFVVDIRTICKVVTEYYLANQSSDYSDVFISTMYHFKSMVVEDINFDEEILLETAPEFPDAFSRIVGTKMLALMNEDYDWHLLFKILFSMFPLDDSLDFKSFVLYIRDRYAGAVNSLEEEELRDYYMTALAESFSRSGEISFVGENHISPVVQACRKYIRDAEDAEDIDAFETYLHEFEVKRQLKTL